LLLSSYSSLSWIYLGFGLQDPRVIVSLLLLFAFLVKIPIYGVHLWLPKAHVEAPVAGSIILAGVLLKLGGYGIFRMGLIISSIKILKFESLIISISLVGAIYVGFICLRQVDVKSLIAYSSVCHMGLVIGGLMSISIWGINGVLVLILSHGLCSSGLFCAANILYERLFTRNIIILKGIILLFPSITLWWFLLCVINIGAPPFINLLGEILLIGRVLKWSALTLINLSFISFVSSRYSLYLYRLTQHGKRWVINGVERVSIREYLLIYSHVFTLGLYVLKIEVISYCV